jgi:hypothetical protein
MTALAGSALLESALDPPKIAACARYPPIGAAVLGTTGDQGKQRCRGSAAADLMIR